MGYNFKYKKDNDGSYIVYDNYSLIKGHIINEAGDICFKSTRDDFFSGDVYEFKDYCKVNNIPVRYAKTKSNYRGGIIVNCKDIDIEGLPDEYKSDKRPNTDKPLKEKSMEYNFRFKRNEHHIPMIYDSNSNIKGHIGVEGNRGEIALYSEIEQEIKDFKKYCKENNILTRESKHNNGVIVRYSYLYAEGLPLDFLEDPNKPLKEKTMEYNFKFHESKDIRVHSDTIYDSNNNIEGVIQSDGTVILNLKKEKEEFKKYCDNNNIKWNLFIGDDTGMIVVNYKDLNIEGLPQGYVKEYRPNPEDFESNTEEINEAGELPFGEENNEPLKTDTIETEDKKWITYKETKSEEDYNIEYILLEEFIDSIMHELQGERIDDFLYLIFLLHEKRDAMYTQKTDGSFASKFILKIISSSEKNYLQAVILADGQNTIYYPKNKEIYINKDIDSNIGDSLCISYNTDKQISSICTDLIKLNEDSLYTLLKGLTQNYKIEKVNNEYILTQEMIMG